VAKRQIRVREALKDLRSGMNDVELMAKYHLAARGLQSLFQKLVEAGMLTRKELDARLPGLMDNAQSPAPLRRSDDDSWTLKRGPRREAGRPIKASEAVRDIRAGMDDGVLMAKYQLTVRGLQDLFDKLVHANVVTRSELDSRMPSFDSTVDLRDMIKDLKFGDTVAASRPPVKGPLRALGPTGLPRPPQPEMCEAPVPPAVSPEPVKCAASDSGEFKVPGLFLVAPVPIYDAKNPRVTGTIRDVTETMVGLVGIGASLDEVRTFIVAPEEYLGIAPFKFASRCRWRDPESGDSYARYQIIRMSDEDRAQLRNLIHALTLGF
jgi:hypothetical protein